jgi:hypothetical protein
MLHSLVNKVVYSTMIIFQLLPPMYNRNLIRKDKTLRRGCQGKKAKVRNDASSHILLLR